MPPRKKCTKKESVLLCFRGNKYHVYRVDSLENFKNSRHTVNHNGNFENFLAKMLHRSRKYLEDLAKDMNSRQLDVRLYRTNNEKNCIEFLVEEMVAEVSETVNAKPTQDEIRNELEITSQDHENRKHSDKIVSDSMTSNGKDAGNNNHNGIVDKNLSLISASDITICSETVLVNHSDSNGFVSASCAISICPQNENKELGQVHKSYQEVSVVEFKASIADDVNSHHCMENKAGNHPLIFQENFCSSEAVMSSPNKTAVNDTSYSPDDISHLSGLIDPELDSSGLDGGVNDKILRVLDLSDMFNLSQLSIGDSDQPALDSACDTSDKNEEKDEVYKPPSNDVHSNSDDSSADSDNDSVLAASINKSVNTSGSLNTSYAAGAIDDAVLFAQPAGKTKSKQNFCLYCKKLQTVISRHLQDVHSQENEVKAFSVLPKGNPERRKIIETIRLQGNYLYNRTPEYNKDGHLLVSRRPKEVRSAKCYGICHKCSGSFSKKTIRKHRQRCVGSSSKNSRSNTILSRRVAGRIHEKAGKRLKDVIFCVLREDEIVRLIRYDELLIIFANDLCKKYVKQQQHDMIRARLRLLGRLLRTVKSKCPQVSDFASLYQPRFYDIIISAINIEARFNEETGEHEVPSVVTTLGTYLKAIGKTFIVECIKKGDKEKQNLAEDFLKVHEASYSVQVNKIAIEAQVKKNRQQKKLLPTTEDILKFQLYLATKWKEAYNKLSNRYSYDVWLELAKTTLTQILLFNRRRVGEIERTMIDDLKSCERVDEKTNPQIYNSLSEEEKSLVKEYTRFVICGKLGRTVPVLLSTEMESSLNMILKYRTAAKVHVKSPFVFGIPGYDKGRYKYLRACALLRQYSEECGAEHPERLRGTYLRKHMATTCAALNIAENEVHDIANFMGHADAIHRSHYRHSVVSRDVCGVSKMLRHAMGFDQDATVDRSDSEKDEDSSQTASHRTASVDDNCYNSDFVSPPKKKKRIANVENENSKRASYTTTSVSSPQQLKIARKQRRTYRTASRENKNRENVIQNDESTETDACKMNKGRKKQNKKKKHDKATPITSTPTNPVCADKKRKIRWTQEEKDSAWMAFGRTIENERLPNTKEIKTFLTKNTQVQRTVDQIRTWASNMVKTMKNRHA